MPLGAHLPTFGEFKHEIARVQLPFSVANYKAFAPLNRQEVLLFSGDELLLLSAEGMQSLIKVELPFEEDEAWAGHHLTPRLIISPDERFCALVHDYGRYGILLDLRARKVIMHLDRGDYFPRQTPFPAAFATHKERCVLIHGTDWNRVDASDAATGKPLTERSPTRYEGETRPEHYLDYFHGRLHVSPDSKWILDDGWIWQPFGMPALWSVEDWLGKNVWESEDGTSYKSLSMRDDWDVPMTFLDNNRVAVSGLGDDDEEMEAGARIFDVRTGEEVNAFAGPSGEFFSNGRQVLSAEQDGLHFWECETGKHIGIIEGFKPQFRVADALIEVENDLLRFCILPLETDEN